MTILITGSQGLIGNALKLHLKNQGMQVKGFDCRLESSHAEFGDITDPVSLENAIKGCEGIIHLAAISRVVWAEDDPILCHTTNIQGTQKLFELAHQHSISWVLYASSREVYGQQRLPVSEESPLQPLNVYARSKVKGEETALAHRALGINSAILRFSNVYGDFNDHADRVVPAFCYAALFSLPLRIEGPDNIFDFTHINDVITGIAQIISLLRQGEKNLPTIHLTSGVGTSLLELAQHVCDVSGNTPIFNIVEPRNFDVSAFVGDPSLAKEYLGWRTTVAIEDGVRDLMRQFSIRGK